MSSQLEYRADGDLVRHRQPPRWWLREIEAQLRAAADEQDLPRLYSVALLLLRVIADGRR